MASTTGQTDRTVIDDLLSDPKRFVFFQAVRLLEKHLESAPIGYEGSPRSEPLRFRALDSLHFPTTEIQEIEEGENPWDNTQQRFTITANFLGLYGPASPLPSFYTEQIIQTGEIGDDEDRERLRAFYDIFHHRIFSLFYRCMMKYRYHLVFEKGGTDRFSGYMRCLIGRGTRGMPADRPVPAVKMFRYSGILTQQPKSADCLRGLLSDYFRGVGVDIESCVGRWLRVEDQNRLGRVFCTLGEDTIVGSQMFDRSGKFRVSLGPVGLEEFMRFLPTGRRMAELKELAQLYLLDALGFNVTVWLKADEVPPTRLGCEEQPPLLGWTSWIVDKSDRDRSVEFRMS